ncbi:MAG: hypothetical protein A2133_00285 [Actinobacteria bacterium RBG_16_64_13]|nr:MAG: hypothetical protein A2133_00285 [Actinobacteria bacterium RBG_16_64_13]
MTTLFVDADACPVTRDAIAMARSRSTPVVLVANESQDLARFAGRTAVEILQVGSGRDSADFAMVPRLTPGDVVVTGDLGLASMALARGSHVLSPRGRQYLPATIDAEMAIRHAEQQHRRAGGRTKGPTPFLDEDRQRFRESLARLLTESALAG